MLIATLFIQYNFFSYALPICTIIVIFNMATTNGKTKNVSVDTQVENQRKAALTKFTDSSYNKPISRAPIAQILNGQQPDKIGLFIKENVLEIIDWKGDSPTHTHVFSSGDEEKGVLLQSPKLNIIQVSPRFIELREDEEGGAKAGTLLNMVFESNEGYEFYEANKDKYVLRRFYFMFVLDENNQNLHEIPIAVSLKGVASTKFGLAYDEFKLSLETAFANYAGTNRSSKNEEFHRLAVFQPNLVPSHEPKTEQNAKKRSWVAIVDSFNVPKPDGSDFENFFCEWKQDEYNQLVATNPDLTTSINKVSPIIEEHNRLVSGANLLPPVTQNTQFDRFDEPPY